MEWVANTADARNNLFEDHDIYSLSLGEDKLIDEIRIQLIKDVGP